MSAPAAAVVSFSSLRDGPFIYHPREVRLPQQGDAPPATVGAVLTTMADELLQHFRQTINVAKATDPAVEEATAQMKAAALAAAPVVDEAPAAEPEEDDGFSTVKKSKKGAKKTTDKKASAAAAAAAAPVAVGPAVPFAGYRLELSPKCTLDASTGQYAVDWSVWRMRVNIDAAKWKALMVESDALPAAECMELWRLSLAEYAAVFGPSLALAEEAKADDTLQRDGTWCYKRGCAGASGAAAAASETPSKGKSNKKKCDLKHPGENKYGFLAALAMPLDLGLVDTPFDCPVSARYKKESDADVLLCPDGLVNEQAVHSPKVWTAAVQLWRRLSQDLCPVPVLQVGYNFGTWEEAAHPEHPCVAHLHFVMAAEAITRAAAVTGDQRQLGQFATPANAYQPLIGKYGYKNHDLEPFSRKSIYQLEVDAMEARAKQAKEKAAKAKKELRDQKRQAAEKQKMAQSMSGNAFGGLAMDDDDQEEEEEDEPEAEAEDEE